MAITQQRGPLSAGAFDVRNASEYLGVSPATVWRLLRDGDLPRSRIRGRTLIRRTDLDALLTRTSEREA